VVAAQTEAALAPARPSHVRPPKVVRVSSIDKGELAVGPARYHLGRVAGSGLDLARR
jgi:hypothetical protein